MTTKTITVAQQPTILSNEEGFRRLIEQNSVQFLVDYRGFGIEDFSSLVDGGTYTLGPPIRQQQQQGR